MIAQSRLTLAGICVALCIETAFYCWVPLGFRVLVDNVAPSRDYDLFSYIVLSFAGGALLASCVGFARDYLYATMQSKLVAQMRQDMFECLQQLSMSFHLRAAMGDMLGAFSRDLAAIENAASGSVPHLLLPLIQCVTCTLVLLFLDWRLAATAWLLWPWMFLAPRRIESEAVTAKDERQADEETVLDAVYENLSAQTIVRAFSLERFGSSVFRRRNENLSRSAMRAGLLTLMRERMAMSGILLIQITVFGLASWLVMSDRLSLGTLVAAQILTGMLALSLSLLAHSSRIIEAGKEGMARINAFLSEPVGMSDAGSAVDLPPFTNEIRFRGVDFSYAGQDLALDGAYARIKQGSFVAFVGTSGAGKSTMLNLLMRLFDPQAGVITVDGQDIRGFKVGSLRSQMAVVLEDNFLFSTSIKENIRLGRPGASDEEVIEAAKLAEIHDFIVSLPEGYDSQAGERGEPFSHANRQRIALARAMLRKPSILLLDEATSALDPLGEAAITQTIERLAVGRTVISVTHRLSSAQGADHIFVFDRGRVAEQGNHAELLAAGGTYASLWQKQAGFTFSADGGHVDVDAKRLRALPILESIDEARLEDLAPFFATENYASGREIVRQGDPGDKFYIIVRGKVEVLRQDGVQHEPRRVAILHDGDYFGEITLLTGFPRTATVRTLTLCTCISLERTHFNRMLERFPELQNEISNVARDRLKLASAATL